MSDDDDDRYAAAYAERFGARPASRALRDIAAATTIDQLVFTFAHRVADALYARRLGLAVRLARAYADREAELLGFPRSPERR